MASDVPCVNYSAEGIERWRQEWTQAVAAQQQQAARKTSGSGGIPDHGGASGCFAVFKALFGVSRRSRGLAQPVSNQETPVSETATADAKGTRLFGLAGTSRRKSPAAALQSVADQLTQRIAELEGRAEKEEAKARSLAAAWKAAPAGAASERKKAEAKQMLSKAKRTQQMMVSAQGSLYAIEQQIDTLGQASVQKELAAALKTTSASMKKNKKHLEMAEDAIDDAAEARDAAQDLSAVMSEFASGAGCVDEDELELELRQMLEEPQPAGEPEPAAAVEPQRAAALPLADFPPAPTHIPSKRHEDRESLLAAAAS